MEPNPFHILPWNGYSGAISLTFDDGDDSQLHFAIPEMDRRNIRGTFYLIGNRLTEIDGWKSAFASGQEIGNHSLDHKHAQDLAPQETIDQVNLNKRKLEDTFGVSIPTYAYPFTEITPPLRQAAQNEHFLSRGGYGPVYMTSTQEPDWHYLASQVIYTHTSSGILKGWTDLNIYQHTWSIPQFHAFAGSSRGWQPLPTKTFTDFLDDLVVRKNEIWIAPIGEVGSYWMAQTIVQKAELNLSEGKITYRWKRNALLPKGIRLKIICTEHRIHQGGKELSMGTNRDYVVDFDQEELTLIPH